MSDFINQFSKHLQSQLNLNDDRTEVISFGLYTFFNTVAGFAAIIIVGYLLGALEQSLTAAVTSAIFRSVSGGAHSVRLRNCTILGAIVSPGIGVICKWVSPRFPDLALLSIVVVVWLLSLISVSKFAPADTPKRPITRPDERIKFRRLSFAFLLIWILAISMAAVMKLSHGLILASTLGLLWQAHSITPGGYRLVKRFDQLLS
jgi:accessory gene regulator B